MQRDRHPAAGAEGQGSQHQRGCRRHPPAGGDPGAAEDLRPRQVPGIHPRADRHDVRGFQAADEERNADAARDRPGSDAQHHRAGSRDAEVLRRAQERVHAQGSAGLPQPDPDLHRGQDAGAGGRRREEGQGPGGARARRARSSATWRATIPTTWRPPRTAATSARCQARHDGQGHRRRRSSRRRRASSPIPSSAPRAS